jgi:HAD superfamily hydrolase (TIGR01509 family)
MANRVTGKGRLAGAAITADEPIQAVLTDGDGTLWDSEVVLYRAWVEHCAASGADFRTMPYARIIGRPDVDCSRIVCEHFGLKHDPVEWHEEYRQILTRMMHEGLQMRPGALEFIERVKGLGLPLALVTSANEEHASFCLDRFEVRELFDAVVTADTPGLTGRKPLPDPYLLAASTLGVDPKRCLVFEDSPSGITAGLKAGCFVFGCPHQHALQVHLARAHTLLWTIDCWRPETVNWSRSTPQPDPEVWKYLK